jgi:beta-glucosidase
MVLLKNDNQILPLDRTKIKRIAVLGRLADKVNLGDKGSSLVRPPYAVTPLQAIRSRAGGDISILSYSGKNPVKAARTAARADVTIIVTGLTSRQEGEYFPRIRGGDRIDLGLDHQDTALIRAAARQGVPCVVILEGGSAITMDEWKDDAAAVLMAWYPGMEGGNAIADILFGEVNPGGRLPITFFKSQARLFPFDKKARKVTYDLHHGYRFADVKGITPAFYFGFGLSYTAFSYADLRLADERLTSDGTLTACVDITNSGKRTGDEVVQLYIEYPETDTPRPVKELKAFKRISLAPGETKIVELAVPVSDLAYFSIARKSREIAPGQYIARVGPSSDPNDLRLSQAFIIE